MNDAHAPMDFKGLMEAYPRSLAVISRTFRRVPVIGVSALADPRLLVETVAVKEGK
jgi:hypothetical protein